MANSATELLIYTGPPHPLANPFYATAPSPLEAVQRFREQIWADIQYFEKYEMVTQLLLEIAELAKVLDTGDYGLHKVEKLTLITHAKQPETDHAQVIGAEYFFVTKTPKVEVELAKKVNCKHAYTEWAFATDHEYSYLQRFSFG